MLSSAGVSQQVLRCTLFILLSVVSFSVIISPQVTSATSPPANRWRTAGHGNALDGILNLVVPTWSANVRANTDTTGYGQHEPALAVSPINPNVVVVANKDYREGDIKHVWIEASRDGGLTWPPQFRMTNNVSTETESDPVVIARDDGRIYVSCLTTGNNGIFITWS